MRTSSIEPAKNSPQIVLPPSRSGLVEPVIAPLWLSAATCTPLTYVRNAAPS
jgi:hypothetical protein